MFICVSAYGTLHASRQDQFFDPQCRPFRFVRLQSKKLEASFSGRTSQGLDNAENVGTLGDMQGLHLNGVNCRAFLRYR